MTRISSRSGGFGNRGQSEIVPTNRETELTLPLKHLFIALLAGIVLILIVQRGVVIPLTNEYAGENAVKLQLWIWNAALRSWTGLVCAYLAAGFLVQFFDPRAPAPYAQRQPGDPMPRPAAPAWIARAVGWRPQSGVTAQAQADAQELGRPTPIEHVIEASILIGTERTKQFANVTLELEEWRQLARYLATGERSVSTRDLERGGFSKGAEGSARRVNVAITENAALFDYGKWRKPVVKDEFAAWVMRREFENL